jgi:hypothetical protein
MGVSFLAKRMLKPVDGETKFASKAAREPKKSCTPLLLMHANPKKKVANRENRHIPWEIGRTWLLAELEKNSTF